MVLQIYDYVMLCGIAALFVGSYLIDREYKKKGLR